MNSSEASRVLIGIRKSAAAMDYSPAIYGALGGAGLGAVTGLFSKKKHVLRNALLGAGLGGAAGYGLGYYNRPANVPVSYEDDYARAGEQDLLNRGYGASAPGAVSIPRPLATPPDSADGNQRRQMVEQNRLSSIRRQQIRDREWNNLRTEMRAAGIDPDADPSGNYIPDFLETTPSERALREQLASLRPRSKPTEVPFLANAVLAGTRGPGFVWNNSPTGRFLRWMNHDNDAAAELLQRRQHAEIPFTR